MKRLFLITAVLLPALTLRSHATPVYLNPAATEDISRGLPDKFANWKSPPDIKICSHAPVTRSQVTEALGWWKKRGYLFGSIISSNCVENHHYGFIVLDLIGQDFNIGKDLATTKIHHDTKTGEIRWATIYLMQPVRERILEHEIGHALGWLHSSHRGHILFPTWQGGGWGDEGLKKPALNLTRKKSASKKP